MCLLHYTQCSAPLPVLEPIVNSGTDPARYDHDNDYEYEGIYLHL